MIKIYTIRYNTAKLQLYRREERCHPLIGFAQLHCNYFLTIISMQFTKIDFKINTFESLLK